MNCGYGKIGHVRVRARLKGTNVSASVAWRMVKERVGVGVRVRVILSESSEIRWEG